jgi:hypothetical protein
MPLSLRELVDKYLAAAGGYSKSIPISALGLSREEAEGLLSALDEDYHISRYFHLQNAAGASYQINGFPQTHVSIEAEVQSIL